MRWQRSSSGLWIPTPPGCPADDTFAEGYMIQTALKKGPMFRHMDVSAICAPRYQRWALDLAAKKGIPVQESVREGGGNNAASIQTALTGAPAIVCGIPVRYAHSTNCISAEFDFEAAVRMVIADENRLLCIKRGIFQPIAQQEECDWRTIERNIRTAIRRAWKVNRDYLTELARYPMHQEPTVTEFVEILSDHATQRRIR